MALRWELVFFKNSRARQRKAYLARVKTPKLAGGEPILVVGTVCYPTQWRRGVPHSFSGCTSRNFWKNISHFSQNFSLFSKFLKFLKFLKISQISKISQNFSNFSNFSKFLRISQFFSNFSLFHEFPEKLKENYYQTFCIKHNCSLLLMTKIDIYFINSTKKVRQRVLILINLQF